MRLVQKLFLMALVSGLAGPALAQDSKGSPRRVTDHVAVVVSPSTTASPSPAYGTLNHSVEQVFSFGFQGDTPFLDQISDDGSGYRWMTAGSMLFVAPVHLPSGVIIDFIGLDYCDSNPAGDFSLTLIDMFLDHGFNIVGTIAPTDRAGCGLVINTNSFNYLYDITTGRPIALYLTQPNVTDGTVKFRAAEVWYHRVVSSPPVTPTFTDVPANHPQFVFVEALVAAGITAGCGGGNYCPDAPLTRGQMAVYLSTALGLHWPN